MGGIISWFYPEPEPTQYEKLMAKFPDPDPRTDIWIHYILNPFLIIPLYFIGLYYILPRFAPTNVDVAYVKQILKYFNVTMISINALYAIWAFTLIISAKYSWLCQPSKGGGELEEQLTFCAWVFLWIKIFECGDTFLLKLGNGALGPQQLYHHASLYIFAWICVRYVPTGSSIFYLMLNSITHFSLYVIYKWTVLDLNTVVYSTTSIQFVLITIHSLVNIYVDCGYPTTASWMVVVYMMSFFTIYTITIFELQFR